MRNFTCPRTCPLAGAFWCRFRPVLDRLGPVAVNSHTVRVAVECRDADALKCAVEALGGTWLGSGSHRLYEGPVVGLGFRLPNWRYPLVAQASGTLAYDDYGGAWGQVSDLARLKDAYQVGVCAAAAAAQGWLSEATAEGGLLIHHPAGGTLTVSAGGVIDATGFVGHGCHDAILALGLPVLEAQVKPEYSQVAATVAAAQQQ